jgi:hypothetical protein
VTGEPIGILLAEFSKRTGKVLVAPRSQPDQLRKGERSGAPASTCHNKNDAKDFRERTVVTGPPRANRHRRQGVD